MDRKPKKGGGGVVEGGSTYTSVRGAAKFMWTMRGQLATGSLSSHGNQAKKNQPRTITGIVGKAGVTRGSVVGERKPRSFCFGPRKGHLPGSYTGLCQRAFVRG